MDNLSSAPSLKQDLISVIIPTLNEAGSIGLSLQRLLREPGNFEVIVSDGGSCDGTLDVLNRFPLVKKVHSEKGRGNQMNAGAEIARGDIFLFLHADTSLPRDSFRMIREALSDSSVVGGSFCLHFDPPKGFLRVLSLLSRINHPLAIYGDQGLFLRSIIFRGIGGFKRIPIMEDVEIWKRLRGLGKFVKLDTPVVTSARRYLQNGIIRQQVLNTILVILYHLGVSPHRVMPHYYDQRHSN